MDKSSEDIKLMVGGWVGGSSCSIPLLFVGQHDMLEWLIRFVGLLIAGFITGFITVLGNDFYKLRVKDRLFKPSKIKKDGEDKDNKQQVA